MRTGVELSKGTVRNGKYSKVKQCNNKTQRNAKATGDRPSRVQFKHHTYRLGSGESRLVCEWSCAVHIM